MLKSNQLWGIVGKKWIILYNFISCRAHRWADLLAMSTTEKWERQCHMYIIWRNCVEGWHGSWMEKKWKHFSSSHCSSFSMENISLLFHFLSPCIIKMRKKTSIYSDTTTSISRIAQFYVIRRMKSRQTLTLFLAAPVRADDVVVVLMLSLVCWSLTTWWKEIWNLHRISVHHLVMFSSMWRSRKNNNTLCEREKLNFMPFCFFCSNVLWEAKSKRDS